MHNIHCHFCYIFHNKCKHEQCFYLISFVLKKKIYWNNNLLNAILLNIKTGNIKQINIKNRTYYFFNDMINIKDFDSSLINTEKVLQKYWHLQYWLHHSKNIDDYEIINSVNLLYKADGYIGENNGNKY